MLKQVQKTMTIPCRGQGFNDFTREVKHEVHGSGIITGLVCLFIKDTGCSMSIQENSNPETMQDMETLVAHDAPEAHGLRQPQAEAADAHGHTRMALTAVSLSIPVQNGRLVLGTWQGICLYEHHSHAKNRRVFFHIIGD
ncbi:MAG: hypothetical protein CO187_03135 [Zetaproteobacteria bacterium CG_4_9_14_3_um_filter_53_7]|nr:MAG: hypothetical protein CO187_03135 [Zetaproteobacteria bacterium CG_4_9_14_3_um_filter_53_7]